MTTERTSTKVKKEVVLKALEMSLGVVTPACKKAKIARKTFYDWYNNDSRFRAKVDNLEDLSLDLAETKLYKNVRSGYEASIFFLLKTKGKKRGYIEKQQIEIETPDEITLDYED